MGLLTGKTAIVTGAARGIGKAIALKFASEGANIAFTDLIIDENGQNTEKEIAAFGVKVKGYASNAASFEDTAKVVEQIKEDFGTIDILVNNAGITKDGLMSYQCQLEICFQFYSRLYTDHDASEEWQYHQYGFCSGCSR